MNEIVEELKIEKMIYEIRGKQVMLDSDLAKLYQVETKRINEAVSRNKEKFPVRFSFTISEKEYNLLKSQIAISKGGSRKGHRVFTVMDAFVAMRKYIGSNLIEQKYINHLVIEHEDKIKLLETSFEKLEMKKNEIYFNGQIYDAYSKILDIMSVAKEEIILIDGYADKSVLDMIRNTKVKVILIIKNCGNLKEQDILKYQEQYDNLHLIYDTSFHDRYIILDKKVFYHCGASLNHAFNKSIRR